jgi:hypothetical protein
MNEYRLFQAEMEQRQRNQKHQNQDKNTIENAIRQIADEFRQVIKNRKNS